MRTKTHGMSLKQAASAALVLMLSGCGQSQDSNPAPTSPATQAGSEAGDQAKPAQETTIDGVVSDSMCGLNHEGMIKTGSMGKDDTSCTIECVKAGSYYVLADPRTGKIYRLSDPEKAREFAGKKVVVVGTVGQAGRSIEVKTITAR